MTRSKTHVVVVEDQDIVAEVLQAYLARDGISSERVADGSEAIARIAAAKPDLVLLDVALPGMDGLAICRELRKASDIGIIMVTSRTEEIDRLLGLELGADDYICKPFSPREVVSRVKAVLRRTRPDAGSAKSPDLIEIDAAAFACRIKGTRLDLTPKEFQLLSTLAATPGRIYARAQLLDLVSADGEVFDRAIDSHVKNLRKKIAAVLPGADVIQSVYGVGYRFEAPEG